MYKLRCSHNAIGVGNSLVINELHRCLFYVLMAIQGGGKPSWIVFFVSISLFSACTKEQNEASGKQAARQQDQIISNSEEWTETHDSNIFHQLDSAEASDLWRELYGDSVPMPHWI